MAARYVLHENAADEMMTMRGQRVPSFLYNAVAAQTALDWDGVSELKLMKYLVNVVRNGVIANFLTWVPFIFFPWLTLVATGRRHDGSAHILVWVYFCFFSTIVSNVWLEFKSLKDVLPRVLRVARPTILGCQVPWFVFLVYYCVFTLICHADTMTNALFCGQVVHEPRSTAHDLWVSISGICWRGVVAHDVGPGVFRLALSVSDRQGRELGSQRTQILSWLRL